MITSARQGRKEKTEKSLWNFFFLCWDVFSEEEEAAGWGLNLPKPCPQQESQEGTAAAPLPRGVRLVNHCRPVSPALGAHWKTPVNQQMMPSNFPISRPPEGCSFLQLAEERRRPPASGLCTPQRPRGVAWGRAGLRAAAAQPHKASRPRQPRAGRHQSGESSAGSSSPLLGPGPFPRGGGQRGEPPLPPAPRGAAASFTPTRTRLPRRAAPGAPPRGPGAVDPSLPAQPLPSPRSFSFAGPRRTNQTHRANNRGSLSAVNGPGRVCGALAGAEGRARARRAAPGWPRAQRPGCRARRPRRSPGRAAGSGSAGTGAVSGRAGVGRERQICWRRRERCCLAKFFSKLIKGTEMNSGPLKSLMRFNTKNTHLTWKVNDTSAARVSKWASGTGWFLGFLLHLPPSPQASPLPIALALARPGAEKLFAPHCLLIGGGGRERNNLRRWAGRAEVEGKKLVSKNLPS